MARLPRTIVTVAGGLEAVVWTDVAQTLAGPWLDGSASLPADLSKVLGSLDTGDITNLTLSAVLMKLISAGGSHSGKLRELLDTAQNLGLADAPVAELVAAKR